MKFKEYTQGHGTLFPHNFDDFIPQNDPVRIINRVVEQIDLSTIIATYKDNGCSAYHPKLLIKVITYAYMRNKCINKY
ncbi:MAG: hypothetical protein SNI70_04985 [Rikenellaceae bacterium]